ncbi:uncharacterized protein [Euwallacea fornicatus]|uniref:uncharacterized protein n=1 Tax=Euwallacea fornicatus TaxID=995702 RepID=UPI00338D7F2C
MEIQDSKLGVPSGKKGAVAKTILKERRDVTGRVTMPLVRKGSVPESLMRKEEVEGAEIGFAKRGKVQRTPPKDKGGETEENVVSGQNVEVHCPVFSVEEVPNSAPKGKRKRMDESIVGGEEEGPRALLEVAREQELESTGPVGVFEALKVLAGTMLEEGRDSVSIPLVPDANPWQLRKVCELACWTLKENIRVKLYLPGGTSSGREAVQGPGPKRSEEEVVFVAKQEGVSYSDTLRKVRQLVANSQTKVDIGTVRETKKGEVLITLPKGGEQGEELKNILGKGMGEGNVRSGANSKIVVFQLTGLDGVTTGEEATSAVATATGLDSKKLRLKGLKASYGSCQTATFLVREGDAENLRVVTDLRVGINMCRLKERKDSGRCYRCWELGHRAQACKGVDMTRLCARCGKEGHRAKDCKDPRYCPLCKAEGHSAGGPNCKGPVKAFAGGRGTDPEKTTEPQPGMSKNKDEIGEATEERSTEQI